MALANNTHVLREAMLLQGRNSFGSVPFRFGAELFLTQAIPSDSYLYLSGSFRFVSFRCNSCSLKHSQSASRSVVSNHKYVHIYIYIYIYISLSLYIYNIHIYLSQSSSVSWSQLSLLSPCVYNEVNNQGEPLV